MKLRATIVVEWNVNPNSLKEYYNGAESLEEAAAVDQKSLDEGRISALDVIDFGKVVSAKIEPVKE